MALAGLGPWASCEDLSPPGGFRGEVYFHTGVLGTASEKTTFVQRPKARRELNVLATRASGRRPEWAVPTG